MTVRKIENVLRGDRTPAYVNRETGAGELLISPDTWDEWVKEGRLPAPYEAFVALSAFVFALTGLKLRPGHIPLILLMIGTSIAYAIGVLPVMDREGTLQAVRDNRRFEKPSARRRRKEKVARFSAMLAARYADQ